MSDTGAAGDQVAESDVEVEGGRILHVYDTGPVEGAPGAPATAAPAAAASAATALVWQTGSPQTGALLAPVLAACRARGLRLVSYARPGYGTVDGRSSTRQPGRRVADAAGDVAAVADSLGLGRFVAMGASGGGPHTLAAAALLGDRVIAAATLAGVAPFSDDVPFAGSDGWFAGMQAPAGLRAAREGREARERFAEVDDFDPESFVAADYAALEAEWSVLGDDSQAAARAGSEGLVDDDLAFASDWGLDLRAVERPVLVVQGGLDRVIPPSHGRRLLDECGTELWFRPGDGHVSVLRAVPLALDWLLGH